ncbi:MAG TPA: FMN-binding glutamate synthase family protein [Thermoplasmata archaeon]|nr:FMN-binding glutamate synthase family protein [Thermoplasmata archaeon]
MAGKRSKVPGPWEAYRPRCLEHVRRLATTGRMPMRGGGMLRPHPTLDDIVITPAQAARLPVDGLRVPVSTQVTVGEERERPLLLQRPYYVGPMSLGALTPPARHVLAEVAADLGIGFDTGQGGLSNAERKTLMNGARTIAQIASGRFGVDLEFVRSADAVEIALGSGAKPGMGGILLAEKITREIARVRGLPVGADSMSPPTHLDMDSPEDIPLVVSMLREATEGQIPIFLRFAAGDIVNDVRIAVEAGVDAIVVDASECFATAVPDLVGDEAGTPLPGVFGAVRRALRLAGVKEGGPNLLVNGGMMTAADVIKALAMGATAVGLDLSLLVAMGCEGCFDRCPQGDCPSGIAGSEDRFKRERALAGLRNYLQALDREIRMLVALIGHGSVTEVGLDDVRGMTYEVATISGVKLMGYERVLPMWQH